MCISLTARKCLHDQALFIEIFKLASLLLLYIKNVMVKNKLSVSHLCARRLGTNLYVTALVWMCATVRLYES